MGQTLYIKADPKVSIAWHSHTFSFVPRSNMGIPLLFFFLFFLQLCPLVSMTQLLFQKHTDIRSSRIYMIGAQSTLLVNKYNVSLPLNMFTYSRARNNSWTLTNFHPKKPTWTSQINLAGHSGHSVQANSSSISYLWPGIYWSKVTLFEHNYSPNKLHNLFPLLYLPWKYLKYKA